MNTKLPLLLLALLLFNGCRLGPKQIESNRRCYNDAIQLTDREQMLLNLVRLKYRDSPVFLEVGSVSTQHTFSGSADVGLDVRPGVDLFGFGSAVSRTERPTVTYTPLTDSGFQKGLLAPVGLESFVLVNQTGWSWDRVQRLAIKNINGLDNATSAGGPTPEYAPQYAEFKFVSSFFRELQKHRLIEIAAATKETSEVTELTNDMIDGELVLAAKEQGYSVKTTDDGHLMLVGAKQQIVLNVHPRVWEFAEMHEAAQLLKIKTGCCSYEIETAREGQIQFADAVDLQKLTVSSRSILEMMYFLSQSVDVPIQHLRRGLVTVTHNGDQPFDWSEVTEGLMIISNCEERPTCADVAVEYRDHWFYIHEGDLESKSTFDLLIELYNIEVRGGGGGNIPVLTLGL